LDPLPTEKAGRRQACVKLRLCTGMLGALIAVLSGVTLAQGMMFS
jgi:hypothetical protein